MVNDHSRSNVNEEWSMTIADRLVNEEWSMTISGRLVNEEWSMTIADRMLMRNGQ